MIGSTNAGIRYPVSWGVTERVCTAGEFISIGSPVVIANRFHNMSESEIVTDEMFAPITNNSIIMTPDGKFIFNIRNSNKLGSLNVLERDINDTYITKESNLSTSLGNTMISAFDISSDGSIILVGVSVYPFLYAYKYDENISDYIAMTLEELGISTTAILSYIKFSPDDNYLMLGGSNINKVYRKTNSNTYTLIGTPIDTSPIVIGFCNDVVFLGYESSTYLRAYLVNESTFTPMTLPTIPSTNITDIETVGDYVYVSADTQVYIYRVVGDTITLVSTPQTDSIIINMNLSFDKKYMIINTNSGFHIYTVDSSGLLTKVVTPTVSIPCYAGLVTPQGDLIIISTTNRQISYKLTNIAYKTFTGAIESIGYASETKSMNQSIKVEELSRFNYINRIM